MANPLRDQKFVLNFDSLTDTITNLAGALILVVVLILGITGRGKEKGTPLLEQIESLRLEISEVERAIQQLEEDLPSLQRRLERLRQKSRSD